jgi:cytochrome b subunit of formate dehydrogenase
LFLVPFEDDLGLVDDTEVWACLLVLCRVEICKDLHAWRHLVVAIVAFQIFIVIVVEEQVLEEDDMVSLHVGKDLVDGFGKVEIERIEVPALGLPNYGTAYE